MRELRTRLRDLARRFDDVQWHDRCGAGAITMGRSDRKCFAYVGDKAELVTIESSNPAHESMPWQDRVDGMRLRKPK